MRGTVLSVVTMSAVFLAVTQARAFEIKNKVMVSAPTGLAIPLGDFADNDSSNASAGGAKIGFHAGLLVEYGISDHVMLGGRVDYSRFPVDLDVVDIAFSGESVEDAHWKIIEIIGASVKYLILPASDTRPYIRGGVFLGKPSLTVEATESEWSGDYDVSLGGEVALGVVRMFSGHLGGLLEGRFAYLNVSGDFVPADQSESLAPHTASTNGVRDPGGDISRLDLSLSVVYCF